MAKLNKIVTSQIESSTDARHETNTYSYDSDGILVRHDNDRVGQPVVGPGVVYGANKDSADESGLNTIKLVPNEELVSTTNQYLVIEPTLPNHIHIRAGGTQDDSNATLYLGAERNAVVVSDDQRAVEITTRPARRTETYTNVAGTGGAQFIAAYQAGYQLTVGWKVLIENTEYTVSVVESDTPSEGYLTLTLEGVNNIADGVYTFTYEETYNNTWTFTNDGYLSGPAMGGLFATGIMNFQSDLYLQSNNNVNIQSGDDHNIYLSPGSGGKIFLEPAVDHVYVGTEFPANKVVTVGAMPYLAAAVPTSSLGEEGDKVGLVADDANYHYYCTGTYNGTTHIWKRIAWDAGTWGD